MPLKMPLEFFRLSVRETTFIVRKQSDMQALAYNNLCNMAFNMMQCIVGSGVEILEFEESGGNCVIHNFFLK